MKCTAYKLNKLKNYRYVVIFARYKNKWVVCKHKNRNTWETSGGHIESRETPMEAAKREFQEETGAINFEIEPICDYWACDEPHETENIGWSNGQVFLAKVNQLGELPKDSEMVCIEFFDEFPSNLTYPDITKELLPKVIDKINSQNLKSSKTIKQKKIKQNNQETFEIKISDMLKCQYELWEKHKDTWSPMTPPFARNSILWMIEELGEAISIIKKQGEEEIQNNAKLKGEFLEELVDVFMYFLDVLLRYGISGEDFSKAYVKKNNYNQGRNYEKERKYIKKQ